MSRCKAIALLKKRDALTREQFIAHYEQVHVPLILSLYPMIAEYRRNYADFSSAFAFADAAPFDFDCVSEFWFDSRADWDAFMARAADPEVTALVSADEANFIASSYTRLFAVEESITTNPQAGA